MIVGLDEDDGGIFNETIKFVSKIKPFMPLVGVPIPYPGTIMAKKLESDNRLLHKDWFKYRGINVVFSPRLLDRGKLHSEAFSTLKKLYTFKAIIIRCLSQPLKNILNSFFTNLEMRKIFNEIE